MDHQAVITESDLVRILSDENAEPKPLPFSLLERITNGFSYKMEIGRGGFAVVYKGMLEKGAVAVKRLSKTYMYEKEFLREIDCLMKVRHKNIARFLGYCVDTQGNMIMHEGKFVLADIQQRLLCFEFLPNGGLDRYIKDPSCGLDWIDRYDIIKGICEGLHHLHELNIVHLDLKPANILLDENMQPKITDFGTSRTFEKDQSRVLATEVLGTRGYMAPESVRNLITKKYDLYSLGVIIMEIVTGEKTCEGAENVLKCWSDRLNISQRNQECEQIRECVMIGIECMDFDPANRPVNVKHIIERLSALERVELADSSMEPEAWEPCNYQPAMEHAVWIPGVPVSCESESTEMTCLEETFVASFSRGQQLVQHTAAATPNYDPFGVFHRKELELDRDHDQWRKKMHRYPASIRELDERYTVPTIVSIGPYYHGRDHLKKAEEAKHAAAISCIKHSGVSIQEMYDAVVSVAHEARALYDKDTMAGMEDDDFLPMMFYDACFLVQFMLRKTTKKSTMHPWLYCFLKSNKDDIYHDILLLENQLPWVVLETLARFTPMNLKNFAKGFKATLQNSRGSTPPKDLEAKSSSIHGSTSTSAPYRQPHLLGYVRFYIVGTNQSEMYEPHKETKVISFSVSAIELAEMGITLTPSKYTELAHMGFKEGRLSAELFIPPILLSYVSASFLVNMAAFEITSKPRSDHGEDTAVCSYVQLLNMLMDREEDVQELRSRRLLQGGGGLTNKETLDFFTSLQGVTRGPLYHRTIRDVEMYKQNRRMWVKVYAFCYKYKKTMLAVLPVIATLSGIFGALSKK